MANIRFGNTQKKESIDPKQGNLVASIEQNVQDSEESVSSWESKQAKNHRLRMRIKKVKNFPFPNSSNLRMPTAEQNIRKLKASLTNVIFGIRPVVSVTPTPGGDDDTAQKLEKFLDHLVMDVMDIRQKAVIAIDQTLEKGFFLMKPYWRRDINDRKEKIELDELTLQEAVLFFHSEDEDIVAELFQRLEIDKHDVVFDDNFDSALKAVQKAKEGVSTVEFTVRDVTYDFPDISLVSPERCYVPDSTGVDPQKSEFIAHEFFMHIDDIGRSAGEKGWNEDAVSELKKMGGSNESNEKQTDIDKDIREGVNSLQKDGLVKIVEYYGYEDIDGSGKKKKSCITYARDFKLELRKVEIDMMSMKFPFVKLFYELINDRWFSHRGIPEILEDIIKEIDVQHNMKIDNQTIRNAPMFLYRSGMVNPNMIGMRPNGAIPVKGTQPLGDVVQSLNFHNPNVEFSYEREQLLLETKVTEIIGQADFSLQSVINKREPRTLGEVNLQQQSFQNIFSLDSQMFVDQFGKLFEFILELWSMHGPDVYEFNYFGGASQGESIKLSREEIQNKYTIKVRGNDNNTNPQVRIQKAQQILALVQDPLLLQSGLVGPEQLAEGIKEFMKVLDIQDPERFINAQPQKDQSVAEAERANNVKQMMKYMTKSEQAQALQQMGIDPDVEGRSDDEERDIASEEANILKTVRR